MQNLNKVTFVIPFFLSISINLRNYQTKYIILLGFCVINKIIFRTGSYSYICCHSFYKRKT